MVAAGVPVVATTEIRGAPVIDAGVIQPLVGNVGGVALAEPSVGISTGTVVSSTLSPLVSDSVSLAPNTISSTLRPDLLQPLSLNIGEVAPSLDVQALANERNRQLATQTAIQQAEAEAIARSRQVADDSIARSQAAIQQAEAEAIARSQQIADARANELIRQQLTQSQQQQLALSRGLPGPQELPPQQQLPLPQQLPPNQQLVPPQQLASPQQLAPPQQLQPPQQLPPPPPPQQSSPQTAQQETNQGGQQQVSGEEAVQLEETRRKAEAKAVERNRQIAAQAAEIEEAKRRVEVDTLERNRQLAAQAAAVEENRLRVEAEVAARTKALAEEAALEDSRQRAEAEAIERSRQILEVAAKEQNRRAQVAAEEEKRRSEAAALEERRQAEAERSRQQDVSSAIADERQRQLSAASVKSRAPVQFTNQQSVVNDKLANVNGQTAAPSNQQAAPNNLRLLQEQSGQRAALQIQAIEEENLRARSQLQAQEEASRQRTAQINAESARIQEQIRQQQSLQHAVSNDRQLNINPSLIPANNIIPPEVGLRRGNLIVSSTISPEAIADNSIRPDGGLGIPNGQLAQVGTQLGPSPDLRTLGPENALLQPELAKYGIDPSQIQLANIPLSDVALADPRQQNLAHLQGLGGAGGWNRFGRHLKKKRN